MEKALFKALRADLHNQPFSPIKSDRSLILTWPNNPSLLLSFLNVKSILLEWIITHRGMGNKNLLRKAKRGLEVGVNRPLRRERAEVKIAIEELRLGRDIGASDHHDKVSILKEDASTLKEILEKFGRPEFMTQQIPGPK